MPHSRTRYVGLDVHKDSIAGAYVARDHDAEIIEWWTSIAPAWFRMQ